MSVHVILDRGHATDDSDTRDQLFHLGGSAP